MWFLFFIFFTSLYLLNRLQDFSWLCLLHQVFRNFWKFQSPFAVNKIDQNYRKLTQNTKKIKHAVWCFYSTHILNSVFGGNLIVWLHWCLDVVKFLLVGCFFSKCCLVFDLEWMWVNHLIWGENLYFSNVEKQNCRAYKWRSLDVQRPVWYI